LRRPFRNLAAAGLTVLLAACVAAWLFTRDQSPAASTKKRAAAKQVSKVDDRLLQTARQLASLADTNAEQEQALEAVRLADQEVDQDFAMAIREAAASAPPASGPLHLLAARVSGFKARLQADQQRVTQLTQEAAKNAAAGDRLELVKAQLALDQDELDDAQQDLQRQGGDEHANLEQALQQHEAVQHAPVPPAKLSAAGPPGTLRGQIQSWLSLGSRQSQVQKARDAADKKAGDLTQEHKGLEGAVASTPAEPSSDTDQDEDTAAAVVQLRQLSDQKKTLADLDKRIQSCQQLSAAYGNWLSIITGRRRTALHAFLGSFAAILAVLLAAVFIYRAIERGLMRQADRRRLHQLRVMARIAIQLVAVMVILLIVFGAPTQTPTIIGLATAGLTVVLKDFIVAFFGWFVLMGKNGIRLGDWVEIEGVGGEVIEVGILRTVLLEMGNWTNTGHPTGRRVAFVNSFAIEGHYFNFSTAGQWLWDELQVILPQDGEPYQMAEQIRQIVERETEADAKLAQEDWERVTHQYGIRPFSARPAVDLRPAAPGLTVQVRYITRAPQRYEVKSRLFQAIVEVMRKPAVTATNQA
jgi:small-conductance mechanosensitive channel